MLQCCCIYTYHQCTVQDTRDRGAYAELPLTDRSPKFSRLNTWRLPALRVPQLCDTEQHHEIYLPDSSPSAALDLFSSDFRLEFSFSSCSIFISRSSICSLAPTLISSMILTKRQRRSMTTSEATSSTTPRVRTSTRKLTMMTKASKIWNQELRYLRDCCELTALAM